MTGDDGDTAETAEAAGGFRLVRMVAGLVAVLLVGLLVVLATRDSEGGVRADSPLLGRLVPEVQATTFDGGAFDVDDHRDGWVVVNFFASWCVPCEREHPELLAFDDAHGSEAVLVSVPFGDTEEDARAFFDEHGGDWPVLLDPDADIAVRFGVLRPPETFLVAPGGTVVVRWQGEITAQTLEGAIDEVTSRAAEAS